jgi:cation transport ATPase
VVVPVENRLVEEVCNLLLFNSIKSLAVMNCSDNTCCSSGSTRPHGDREFEANTNSGELKTSSHAALAGLAADIERHKCCSSHSRTSDESLARESHYEHHEGPSHCAYISSNVTSSRPTMTACERNSCYSRRFSGDVSPDFDPSDLLDSIEIKENVLGLNFDVNKLDGAYSSSHGAHAHQITLSVSGMTCTGCLKNLDRCLDSIQAISNVKTSLLLSQAVFNLQETPNLNKGNIANVIASRTGFSCALIGHAGEDLDLILEPNVTHLGDKWPFGVVDITSTGKNRVRISYQPRMIGARDLLSNPFFQYASLAPPSPPTSLSSGEASVRKSLSLTLLSTILTIPVLVFSYAHPTSHEVLYGGISCGLASLVQFLIVGPFYTKAFKALFFSRMVEMDMLVVLSTTVAYVYSVIAYSFFILGKPLPTGEFFETSTLLVTLVMVGRTVAEYARHKAVESISMESLQKPSATIFENGKMEREIDVRLLQYNDIFKVYPETSIVTDGIIQEGETEVDESMVTGEATLIPKKPGVSVVAGSVNHAGTISVRLTSLPSENTIKTISTMVEEAKSLKPKVQEIANRVASNFVTGILSITPIVFIIWFAVGIAVRHQSSTAAAINAMTFAISTLIVSCPCAIGLAVPMVVLIAGGVGARHGLIFKSTETIEIGRKISHVIFDKTGTLTQGKLLVMDAGFLDDSESITPAILGLIANSKHPVSRAVAGYLDGKGIKAVHVENITAIPGNGIEGIWNQNTIRAGNPFWLGVQDLPSVKRIISKALTTL